MNVMRNFILILLIALCSAIEGRATIIIGKGRSFASQLSAANEYYIIQDHFDLQGAIVRIPSGSTLVFRGGSVRNGTLDLNGCRIEGIGIKCKIKNLNNYSYPLSRYLADTKDAELNTLVVQALMDATVPVIIDYAELTFSRHLSVSSNVTVQSASVSRVELNFPNSCGFVWDKRVFSQGNTFQGLYVKSKGSGFDFVNGGASERPNNVYFSTFKNLRVQSLEGDCFTAGPGNYGATGDSCSFDNLFENIEVCAPRGYGFVGISGNTQHFIKIRCIECGKAFFYNCSGVFDSCNGTWSKTPTFYKGTRRKTNVPARYTCIFRNCNIEDYKSVLFDCKDSRCYMELSFEDCSFYVTPNARGIIDYFPFDFEVLLSLRMKNSFFFTYNNGKYDSKHSLFRISSLSNIVHMDVDQDLIIMDNYSYKYTISGRRMELIAPQSVATRPKNPNIGLQHFDQRLGKPIWWNGESWVDSNGTKVK